MNFIERYRHFKYMLIGQKVWQKQFEVTKHDNHSSVKFTKLNIIEKIGAFAEAVVLAALYRGK